MQAYLAAHDEFIAWLDSLEGEPSAADLSDRLWNLAVAAATRGMGSTHWTFVVDGLVAYVNRRFPGDILLSSNVARGFDLASRWEEVREGARRSAAALKHSAAG